jgi:hypothetical protein
MVPYLIDTCPVSSLDTLQSSIFNSNELTGDSSKFNIKLLYKLLFHMYISCELTEHPPEFNIQLLYGFLSNIHGLDTRLSSIFNSYMVSYPIYTCPVSSLDTLLSSIFNSNELIGDPPEFNIQLQYGI